MGVETSAPLRRNCDLHQAAEAMYVMFDVDFGYEANKPVLHNITLYAEPGQKVAFVGATGAGKTTITNLINRFYDIADGKIRYDGININKIQKGRPAPFSSVVVLTGHQPVHRARSWKTFVTANWMLTDQECIQSR